MGGKAEGQKGRRAERQKGLKRQRSECCIIAPGSIQGMMDQLKLALAKMVK